MAPVNVGPPTFNVTVRQVTGTASTGLGSTFNIGSTATVTGVALASPGEFLTVDFSIENSRGEANTVTIVTSDPSGSNAFLGEGVITWAEGDTSTAWVQFTEFPLQADQETPTGSCDYAITSLTDASASVFTV